MFVEGIILKCSTLHFLTLGNRYNSTILISFVIDSTSARAQVLYSDDVPNYIANGGNYSVCILK